MTTLTRPVARRTVKPLDHGFGPDADKAIVVKLVPGTDTIPDVLELRPERSRRVERIAVIDAYRFALRCRVQRELLEKARERKARKADRLARLRLDRAEKRLLQKSDQ